MSYCWNHRIIARTYVDGTRWYGISEVHYNDDGSIFGYSDPVAVTSESLSGLRWVVEQMQECLGAPVLVEGEFECVDLMRDEEADSDKR